MMSECEPCFIAVLWDRIGQGPSSCQASRSSLVLASCARDRSPKVETLGFDRLLAGLSARFCQPPPSVLSRPAGARRWERLACTGGSEGTYTNAEIFSSSCD